MNPVSGESKLYPNMFCPACHHRGRVPLPVCQMSHFVGWQSRWCTAASLKIRLILPVWWLGKEGFQNKSPFSFYTSHVNRKQTDCLQSIIYVIRQSCFCNVSNNVVTNTLSSSVISNSRLWASCGYFLLPRAEFIVIIILLTTFS